MTGHELADESQIREHIFAAVCECGHESEGPNPDTARKRHEFHVQIQQARAALKGATA